MIRPIITIPDLRLTRVSVPLIVNAESRALAADMRDTMVRARAYGLAAVQVGEMVRLIVVSVRLTGFPFFALFNPDIFWRSDEQTSSSESCLSVPARNGLPAPSYIIKRAARIRVRFNTRREETKEFDASGYAARVIQHEVDHLNGILLGHRWQPAAPERTPA